MKQPLTLAGIAAGALVVLLILGSVVAVALRAERGAGLGAADWAALRFTLWQAALSAVFSVALAIPVARALARRRFRGRGLLITLLGAPFILPVIVAVLGLIMVFGRAGLLNDGLAALGLPAVSIYGAWGVLLAHVFFNLPLATRMILQGWVDIPAERFRLAAALGMGPAAQFRLIELPMLARVVPGAALVVFLICTTSFAVALTLGGGPRATTIELAIYQAFRFDFDLGRAALLALLQLGVTLAAALVALRVAAPEAMGAGLDRPVQRWGLPGPVVDTLAITLATLFLVLPMVALAARGLPHLANMPPEVWAAAWRSVVVALGSAVLTIALALPLAVAVGRLRPRAARGLEVAGMLGIAASPLVIGTGLFIVSYPFIAPDRLALPVTALVNAVMALPFALRLLVPAVARVESDYGRLAASLGLSGFAWLRLVLLPRITRPLGFATGLAAALSMGDLGVVALFADAEAATLPLQMYRLMGAYRMQDAAAAALLLLALSLAAFWIFDRGGRADADA
ncbi:thiamine transport system permease protein [Palleronia salina]|uniref:Thiamine transport system permease protein n=1 Tax=Palleronia salina TaxID=313368 RepID=A0A1M6DB36_9RHOB|nr:thiamine/thiamine pyrophosphate ABC transporter permease ThiP [Palleronia salina]SHI70447.1 thiamine transport system permease protein [Palleronia salina]